MVASTLFHYTARTESGSSVNGTLRSRSRSDALARLRERQLFVTSMEAGGTLRAALALAFLHRHSRGSSRVAFMRGLSTLIASGTPLLRALDVSARQCRDLRFRETLRGIASDVNGGGSLSDAMSRRPLEFSEGVVAMIRAGELGGILDEVLQRGALILEQTERARRQVGAALAYPAFVLVASGGLIVFLLAVTVPAFAGILDQLHGSIPLPTRLLIAASRVLRDRDAWLAAPLAAVVAAAAWSVLAHNGRVTRWVDQRALDIPVLGLIRRQTNVAAFARTTGTLLQCGVSLAAAVDASCGVLTSQTYREAAREAESVVMDGVPLSRALEKTRLFDGLCIELAAVGEESGALDATLLRAAEYLEEEAAMSLRALTAILEPALILALGGIVGGIVASVLVPLYAAVGSLH